MFLTVKSALDNNFWEHGNFSAEKFPRVLQRRAKQSSQKILSAIDFAVKIANYE